MKALWNKHTKLNKFIAFCLVLLLAVVPLLTYVGDKEGAKAEPVTSTTEYYTDTLTENSAGTGVGAPLKVSADETTYYLQFFGDSVTYTGGTDVVYYADQISLNVNVALAGEKHNYSYNSSSSISMATFEMDSYDIKYVASTGTDETYLKTIAAENEVNNVGNLSSYTNGIAVYIKPVVDNPDIDGDNNYLSDLNDKMGYTLIGVYKFTKNTLTAPTWTGTKSDDTTESVVAGTTYKAATFPATDLGTVDVAGSIQYAYILGNTTPDAATVAAAAWSTTNPSLSSSVPDLSDGAYYGCVGYFAPDATGISQLIAYEVTATPVKLDITAPFISNLVVQHRTSDAWTTITADDVDSSNVFTLASAESLQITFTISETGITPTVKLGSETVIGTGTPRADNTATDYVYEITPATVSADAKITVTATDAAGNTGSSIYKIDENEIKFAKVSACFEVTSAKIVGSNSGEIDLTTGGSPKYINYEWFTTNGTPSIQIAMQSDLTTTDVTSSDSTVDANYEYKVSYNTNAVMTGRATYSRPYYQTTIEQSLGTTSQKLENITLEYRKPGESLNTTVNYGTVIYDVNAPTISNAVLQWSIDGTNWYDVDASNIEGTGASAYYYINPLELTATPATQYRYFVAASDTGESGLADTPISCSISSYGFSYDSTEAGYVHNILIGDLAEDVDVASPVSVTATDKAGNVSPADTTYLPRVIKQAGTTTITPVLSKADGTTVDLNATEPFATNEILTLTVTVTSGAKIDSVDLNATVNGTSTSFVAATSNIATTMDSKSKLYTATCTYQIPASTVNSLIESGTIRVTTDPTSYYATKPLRAILYDVSTPVITTASGDALSSLAGMVWQQSYTLNYKIVSGTDSNAESNLANATYTIDNASSGNVSSQPIAGVDGTSPTYTSSLVIPESATTAGTRVVFTATDQAGNVNNGTEAFIKIDAHPPVIGDINVTRYNASTPISGYPTVSANITDNLTIQEAVMKITYPDGTVQQTSLSAKEQTDLSEVLSYQIGTDAPDGTYTVQVTAKDKAGNDAIAKNLTFKLDNTLPVVTAAISSGTAGGKATRADGTDMYYRSDVGVKFTCYDDNIKSIEVTDNGAPIDVSWNAAVGQTTISAEGRHVIKINATDKSDNQAIEKQVEFIIDKSGPDISLVLNGLPYSEASGVVNCLADSTVGVSVSDMTVDAGDLHYQVIQTKPDHATTTSQYLATDARSFTFGEEADYTMNFYAIDMANNQSTTRSISFRIDKAAPELTISGVAGGSSSNATTVSFSMKEAFWKDASGVITIYRKAGDGSEESLYKTVNVTPTAFETVISETLTETGVYRMEFKASDRVGHTASKEQTFTIDREAPVITLSGVNNFDVTDQTVELRAEIADDFYSSKTVSIEGTKTDINGKVTNLSFSSFNQHGNPTVIGESFDQDGIYDITITSKDAAGNSHSSTVHFTVDKTAPKIEGLEELDGAILTSFDFGFDLDELVSDLTVCDVHMYLNGSEYDGVSAVEDGSYTLLITAEDELGHYSELSVSFVLDTKAPVFIVTGVEDGEVKQEAYSIDVSLQLEEDTLTSVTLNGETVVISNNTAHIDVTAEGDYTLCMKAVDEAGNEAEQTIEFRYGQESHLVLWICIIVGIIILAGIIIFIILRRKKNK